MKNKFRILKILVTVITFGFLLSFSVKRFNDKPMEKVTVILSRTKNPVYFIDEKDIKELVKKSNPTKKIGLIKATPAQILEKILSEKWALEPNDKDMIVMYHKFGYELNGEKKQIDSTMVCIGDDQTYTSMAKTVGLPVAIATLKILNKEITTPGVQLPITKEVYNPILKELEDYGVIFKETEVPYLGYNPLNIKN